MKCDRAPAGWQCRRGPHDGPCPADPVWWNVAGMLRVRDAAPADHASWLLLVVGILLCLVAAVLAVSL